MRSRCLTWVSIFAVVGGSEKFLIEFDRSAAADPDLGGTGIDQCGRDGAGRQRMCCGTELQQIPATAPLRPDFAMSWGTSATIAISAWVHPGDEGPLQGRRIGGLAGAGVVCDQAGVEAQDRGCVRVCLAVCFHELIHARYEWRL